MTRIGFFDSGLGGLSVLRHTIQLLPNADFIYVADSAHAPYGEKPPQWVRERSVHIARFLRDQGVAAMVVACNTATALAAETIREQLDVPVIAMEPAIKPASALSRSGCVGVLATATTLQSERYQALKRRYTDAVQLFEYAPHHWIAAIESGRHLEPDFAAKVQRDLQPLLGKGIDTWVLACTHFPLLQEDIKSAVGKEAYIIDPAPAVSAELLRRLPQAGAAQTLSAGAHRLRLLTSGEPEHTQHLARLYLPPGRFSVQKFN